MRLHEIFDFMALKGARICVLLGAEMKYNFDHCPDPLMALHNKDKQICGLIICLMGLVSATEFQGKVQPMKYLPEALAYQNALQFVPSTSGSSSLHESVPATGHGILVCFKHKSIHVGPL
jgi:hypothetical protein